MKPSNSKKRAKKKKNKPSSPSPPENHQPEAVDNDPSTNIRDNEEEEEEKLSTKRDLDLEWLTSAFESSSMEEIVTVYAETGYDAFRAAGVLGANLINPETDERRNIGAKKIKRKNRIGVSSGIVANVIGKDYMSSKSNIGNGKVKEIGIRYKGIKHSIEEGEEFLCSMLGDDSELGLGVVKDVLGQCKYDVDKALETLLDISGTSFNQFTYRNVGSYQHSDHESASCSSSENSISSSELTDKTLKRCQDEKEFGARPYIGNNFRNNTIGCSRSDQQPQNSRPINFQLQQKVLESLFNIPESRVHDKNTMNWKKVVQQVESFGQGLEFRHANVTQPHLSVLHGRMDEYQVCRNDANKHWEARDTYFKRVSFFFWCMHLCCTKLMVEPSARGFCTIAGSGEVDNAANAWSKGERAHAAQLSEMGRSHQSLARKADEEASRRIFEARNKDITNVITIDLHGQHVKQGISLLKLHLLLFTYIPSVQFLKVITGSGGEGAGKGKLKRSVIALVKKEGIEWYEENSGTLLLKLDGMKEYSFKEEENDLEVD